ncbi:MAG: ArsR/SmtB family transcription factor [Anaerocolumna sp.]
MDNNIDKYTQTAEMLKVLAHPVRLCIVEGLIKKGECNVNFMQSCLKAPQSTISQHLQKLKFAGIIEGRREGIEIYYRITDERVKELIKILSKHE